MAGRIALRYTRKTYARCDATITCSAVFWRKLRNLGVPSVKLLSLGVDLDVYHPGRRDPALRRSLGVADGTFLLVYAGRFDTEKRVTILADAMQRLPDSLPAKLALVGEGPMKRRLQEVARTTNRLIVLPYRSDKKELARLLASADLYVTAGPSETFGLSVLEAQACGLPVVGVRAGALMERVSEDTGVLGAVDSPEEMAANISKLLHGELKRMSIAARQKCEASYSWEKTFCRLFELYESIHRGNDLPGDAEPESTESQRRSGETRRVAS
jgi:alpha-1,6-mannosyltransferase